MPLFHPHSIATFNRILLIFVLILFVSTYAFAQLSREQIKKNNKRAMTYRGSIKNRFGPQRQYTSVGITFNSINYFGDLSPGEARISTDLSLTKPGIGATVGHRFGPALTFQVDFLYSRIHGSDVASADKSDFNNGIFRYNRNLSFRNAKPLATSEAIQQTETFILFLK